ncbi:PREDICTED: olfactory receptor 10T2-like [Odobenus rosmarus divergens]|uniref:Olfactory receptor n=1 Tax=Odobenus rosmarus divergens TaxID=9708 RepID=A0A2U3X1B6_ODORO|nr:PREDICTED: olfactory receptor 10T2-like [Odobenus rosmarus divergens]
MTRQNQSMITEFILIGFSKLGDLQILLFFIFLLVYLTTLMANATIMTVIWLDRTLHTPMYFFLFVLSCSETCYTLVIVPKMLTNLLCTSQTISFSGCAAQLFFFVGLACTNCFLIAVMGYDRYVAICNPLNYTLVVSRATCVQLVLASSCCGFLISVVVNVLVFSVPFCAFNQINHFFCDISPVIKLGCTDTNPKEMVIFFLSILVLLVPFLLIFISYVFIVCTILKIASAEGQRKAFATCASHLTVVIVHYGCASFIYLRPTSLYSSDKDRLVAVTYTVITPLLNPLVYTLRNKEVKTALSKVLSRYSFPKTV